MCDKVEGGPTFRRHYVHGHRLMVDFAGVLLQLTLVPEEGIRVSYDQGKGALEEVLLQPTSYQQFLLKLAKGKGKEKE